MMFKPFSILSLDGGGIRGLVTALVLEQLELKIQARSPGTQLKDCFDLMAGTSTGSLIACGLSYGLPISKIVRNYSLESGFPQKIFPRKSKIIMGIVERLHLGISQPIYDGKGLEEVLKLDFKTATFNQLQVQTLVTSYDVFNGQAIVFNSRQPECTTLPVWEVCRASSAAPVGFPAHILKNPKFLNYWRSKGYKLTDAPDDGQLCIPLIDGAVAANNPTLCAIAEAIKSNHDPSRLLVASFGCGTQKTQSILARQAREWGPLEWINPLKDLPILETVSEGSSDIIDHVSQHLVNSNNYYRFQPEFLQKYSSLSANRKNLEGLKESTLQYLESTEVQRKLNRLAVQLTPNPVSPPMQSKKRLMTASHLN